MVDLALSQDGLIDSTWIQTNAQIIKQIEKLPGDASTRRYYRITTDHTPYILMKMESFEKDGSKLPFLSLQNFLSHSGIDVPRIMDVDPSRGFIVLEDLGDEVLLKRLQQVTDPDVERTLYERVLDVLIDFQIKTFPSDEKPALDAFKLRFDVPKLLWEIDFTIEHFYKGYLGRSLSNEAIQQMRAPLEEICEIIANEPTVFTHRDFHSRNIMLHEDRLVMIDFQDARMGPPQYDLASLLKDSYYQLSEEQIEKLLNYYLIRRSTLTGIKESKEHFIYIFDLMSLQRNFKAIGSFASFYQKRGNPAYLKFIGNTFENIRRTLLKYPQYAALREVLFHYYYF